MTMLRGAIVNDQASAQLREFIQSRLLHGTIGCSDDDAALRAGLASSATRGGCDGTYWLSQQKRSILEELPVVLICRPPVPPVKGRCQGRLRNVPMADDPHLLFPDLLVDHLQDLVLKTEGVKEMLDELAEFSAVTLADPAIAFCSITLIQRKKPVTVASSEERAIRLDETQYSSGDGPCLSAIRQQVVVHVPDLTNEYRWPTYTAATLKAGVGSSLSIPLILEGEAEAGLNLYSTRSHGFTGEDISTVETYSYHVSKALRLAVRISQLAEAKTNLIAAMESRTTIDLACGAIMAQNRCSQDTAMKILRIASNTRNVKLRDIAASVVASVSQDPRVRTHFDA
jgi:GAF domain-containing protein